MRDYKHIYSDKLKKRDTSRAVVLLVAFVAMMGVVGAVEQPPVADQPTVKAVAKSATQESIEKLLPVHQAALIAGTSYPKTLAAIAHTESRGDQRAIGDGGKSLGLFQIQPAHWGRVDLDDLEQQVAKADAVFCTLVKQYGYREAVRRWNGDGKASRKYQQVVLAKVAGL